MCTLWLSGHIVLQWCFVRCLQEVKVVFGCIESMVTISTGLGLMMACEIFWLVTRSRIFPSVLPSCRGSHALVISTMSELWWTPPDVLLAALVRPLGKNGVCKSSGRSCTRSRVVHLSMK